MTAAGTCPVIVGEAADNPALLRKLAREVKLRIDPRMRGECEWFREDPRIAKAFFSRRGVSIDAFGELLLDRGYLLASPTEEEVLQILEFVFAAEPEHRRASAREKREELSHLDAAALHAYKTRSLQFRCDNCGAIAYASKNTELACTKCSRERGELVPMTRYGKTMAEVLNSIDYAEVPF